MKKSFGHLKAFNDSTQQRMGGLALVIFNFATVPFEWYPSRYLPMLRKNIKENLDESSEYFEYINSQFGKWKWEWEPDYDNIQKLVEEEGIGYLQENVDLNALQKQYSGTYWMGIKTNHQAITIK